MRVCCCFSCRSFIASLKVAAFLPWFICSLVCYSVGMIPQEVDSEFSRRFRKFARKQESVQFWGWSG